MKRAIHRFKICPSNFRPGGYGVTVPAHSIVLSVGVQDEYLVCWAMVDPDQLKTERKIFNLVWTGVIAEEHNLGEFLTTLQHDEIVTHVFMK